jgi:hypothetical protein
MALLRYIIPEKHDWVVETLFSQSLSEVTIAERSRY